ncbi:MAG TPA: hypothetical protein IAA21_12115 [Candidatus Blautia faecigallinarum]|uniref:LPXTG cell wall anchor domain-containing protein n=1 Tax=Candidatus Blautia faecigallinarum TaxID=2838488 RepID=A0A9D2IU32_9FIRM|nr:hypothetical protein [Candidatus Blautia faecigallinarum]
MRRKQLYAIVLAGALTVSMAPTSVFAAEEAAMQTIDAQAESTGGETVPEAAPEAENTAATQTPAAPSGTPESQPTQTPSQEPSQTPEGTPSAAPSETPAETPSPAPEETAEPQAEEEPAPSEEETETTPSPEPEEGQASIQVGETSYTSLNEAVAAVTGTAEEPAEILITGDVEISETVSIASGKFVIIAAAAENTTIKRADGFTGAMFRVEGGNFELGTGSIDSEEGETVTGSLTVDGDIENSDTGLADGSIVAVTGGTFALSDGVTLSGNMIQGNGGAISNTGGNVALYGGTITGNQAGNGGGVYSEGVIAVRGTVNVSSNTKYGDVAANNIVLAGGASINVTGALTGSSMGVQVQDGAAGTQVVTLAEDVTDVTLADAVSVFTYDSADFTIGEDGTLVSTAVTTPTPTPVPLKLTGVSMEWTGPNSARITCISNKDGWYYAGWVTRGSEPPTFDLEQEGVKVRANREFTIDLTDLDPENPIDVYVRVKDTDNNLSKKLLFQLNESERPANPTPTPGREPIIPPVTDSVVTGLEQPLAFYPDVYYDFTVTGAGSDNTDPILGDVRWVPLYWGMSSNPSMDNRHVSWRIGSEAGISAAGTYNLYIFFQKYEFDGTQWQATDVIEYATYQFRSQAITITASPTPTSTIVGYDENGNPVYSNNAVDGTVTEAGSGTTSTTDSVSTADESPIGTMSMLAAVSLLAGGYVIIRKRKKEI